MQPSGNSLSPLYSPLSPGSGGGERSLRLAIASAGDEVKRPPRRILLVDDSAEFLDSASHFLTADPRIEIVGRACSARVALEQVSLLKPDLVLMDLSMPEMNGLEATRRLKARPDSPRVVVLTLYDHPEYRAAAAAARADGFVAKSDLGNHLLPLINRLFA
jgi:DNA-binding NarL/FixJ family response regulator